MRYVSKNNHPLTNLHVIVSSYIYIYIYRFLGFDISEKKILTYDFDIKLFPTLPLN